MDFSFVTFVLVLAVQLAGVSVAALLRAPRRREVVLAVGLGLSLVAYALARVVWPEHGSGWGALVVWILATNETLPAILLAAFAVESLLARPPRWMYVLFALPAAEVLSKIVFWLSGQSGPGIDYAYIVAGQCALFAGSVAAILLALHFGWRYEREFSDNRRTVLMMSLLPVAVVNVLNLVWFATIATRGLQSPVWLSQTLFGLVLVCVLLWLGLVLIWADKPLAKFEAMPVQTAEAGLTARLERISDFIETEGVFTDPDLSLSGLARHLGTNRTTLSSVINGASGGNFSRYINGFRVSRAQDLLTRNAACIKQIAYDCGFASKSTFNRVFKQVTGLTPRQFRDQSGSDRLGTHS